MRRGLVFSILMHTLLVLFLVFNVSSFLVPEPEITYVNVSLVSSPDAATTAKPQKVKPQKSQQSAAPAAPPKPEKKKVEAPEHATKVVENTRKVTEKKAQKVEPEEQKAQEEVKPIVEEEPIGRPPKLDKTPNKKAVIKEEGKPTQEPEEDFLKALDYIDDIQDKESALAKGPEGERTMIYDETQEDVAYLKRHIEKNWYRPPGMDALDRMKVVIMIKVNRDGTVSNMEVVHSSGRSFFDNSILRAVRKSVPLPLPPEKYDMFKTIQISFNG
mgnify:CR=1 FL=1